MSKVFVIGSSPLPIENELMVTGPSLRTWQFVEPLLQDGHKVCLVTVKTDRAYFHKKENEKPDVSIKNFSYYAFDMKKFVDITTLQRIYNKFAPDCVISISASVASEAAVRLNISCPLWIDRGDLMAEAQLKSFITNDDDIGENSYLLEKAILSKGDKFSAVSSPQRFSVIGRLGMASRLNRHTLGYEFVHVIPCAAGRMFFKKKHDYLRGKLTDADDFIVLWSGGYNTWADIETLFEGIEYAMKRNNKIKFVSTGGALGRQDNTTYQKFLTLVQKSVCRDRFFLLGWIKTENLYAIYSDSNLGINVDRPCYEVLLGSRHRLMDWMAAGLPFITTCPSELTQYLVRNKLAFTFDKANAESMGSKILKLSQNKRLLNSYSRRIKKYAKANCSPYKTAVSLREWVKSPQYAPDKYIFTDVKRLGLNMAVNSFDNVQCSRIEHIKNLEEQRSGFQAHIKNLEDMRESLTKERIDRDKE